ncbi:hypothetical protein DYU11_32160 [Fibrisoma montanum]|uniref:Uncharacterized protein n=1 Tax=Fibrisoma montanum TaxID=2305895 RepID=A0A418LVS1_9BACT|nr:hypothetical protein [Fibrisoma montanum]RIV17344.1 hypothetical protein DYU11_32160 [Fibrisoma montanum]
MKKAHWLTFAVALSAVSTVSFGQNAFQHCTAAFVGNKMVVDQYTTTGKSVLPSTTTGELSVQTVDLSPTSTKALDKIAFKVAIRDKDTKTLVMFSRDEYKQVSVQNVLAKCRKGDHIVLLTIDNQYALPHNEILVQ